MRLYDLLNRKGQPIPCESGERNHIVGTFFWYQKYDTARESFVRMAVVHDDGWIVFGNVPAQMFAQLAENRVTLEGYKGHRVEFDARIYINIHEPDKGKFSRPTKFKLLDKPTTP